MSPATSLSSKYELDDVLPDTRHRERHHRTVKAPIGQVWSAVQEATAGEVRFFGPLMKLRHIPTRHRQSQEQKENFALDTPDRSLLDDFIDAGFLSLRNDRTPTNGRCVVMLGAAAKFWLPDHSNAVKFDGPEEFVAFSQAGFGRTVFSIEAIDRGKTTELVTETRVSAIDGAAERRLRAYWTLVRLPSGLIRRTWLAAIDRRAMASLPQASGQ